MCAPRYRDVTAATIPTMTTAAGATIKVICGEVDGVKGPVEDITIDPQYLDIMVPAESAFEHPTRPGDTVIAYVIGGEAWFSPAENSRQGNCSVLVFSDGDRVAIRTAARSVRFLLISGRPLREPVAWRGPIVMNTEEELRTAFREYHDGTFLKHR